MALMRNVSDFDAFSPGHSQYLTFFFDGGGLGRLSGLGDKERYPLRSIFDVYIHLFDPCLIARN